MLALLPQYNKDAAAKRLSPHQIKKREMEVHQACVGVIVRELNKYSNAGGEVDVLCPEKFLGRGHSVSFILRLRTKELGHITLEIHRTRTK